MLRITMPKISRPWRSARSWLLVAGTVTVLLLARVAVPGPEGAVFPGVWLPPCPMKMLTAHPCPFCGLTSGAAWLLRGELNAAWRSNILSLPFVFIVVSAGLYTVALRFIAGRYLRAEVHPRLRRGFWTAAGFLIALAWLTNLLRDS